MKPHDLLCTAVAALIVVAANLRVSAEESRLPQLGLDAEPPSAGTNLWFDVGEMLVYNIYWGFIHVGETVVTTDWVTYTNGQTLLRVRFETHSNRVLDKIYPVRDIQESVIDPGTFLPVYFLKDSRQGRHTYHEIVYFDHANRKARWESLLKGRTKEVEIDADCRDIITTMYFMRKNRLSVGEDLQLRVYTDEKVYDLTVKVPKRESVKLARYGDIDSTLFEPEASFQGLFVRKGRVFMWVSEDARRILTRMSAKIPVASIHMELQEVRGPGEDFWVREPAAAAKERKRPQGRSFGPNR